MTEAQHRHGGQILIDALKINGVRRVFCIPGESYLAALDGLYDSGVDTIVARHEGAAAMMAEAHAKLTGMPGIAFVTRGPGATNASAGVHVAMQDSTPMILFVGQVASDQRDREAFQEVDYRRMFGPLAKWVAEVDRTDRLPEYISHAFHTALSGRPGPVVLALPEDMLSASAQVADVPAPVLPSGLAHPSEIDAILDMLAPAEQPLIIAGGSGWSAQAAEDLAAFASTAQIPVATSFRCQDYIDNRHDTYAGDLSVGMDPALATRVQEADTILALGSRLGEISTRAYTLLNVPKPAQRLIHVHAGAEELGRVYRPDLAVNAAPAQVIAQLREAASRRQNRQRSSLIAEDRSRYDAFQTPKETPGELKMERVIAHLNDVLPDDAILTNGAGNYAAFLHRYYRYRNWRTQLAPTSGSMGYGLPAAIAAKLEHPDRDVICLAGDGCLQMVMQEMGTAAQYGANVIVLVSNNGMYGTIRMHQQRNYPKRPSGTQMVNPDFAALARAYGGYGATVKTDAEFPEALAQARAAGKPAILDLQIDPRALSTGMVLEET